MSAMVGIQVELLMTEDGKIRSVYSADQPAPALQLGDLPGTAARPASRHIVASSNAAPVAARSMSPQHSADGNGGRMELLRDHALAPLLKQGTAYAAEHLDPRNSHVARRLAQAYDDPVGAFKAGAYDTFNSIPVVSLGNQLGSLPDGAYGLGQWWDNTSAAYSDMYTVATGTDAEATRAAMSIPGHVNGGMEGAERAKPLLETAASLATMGMGVPAGAGRGGATIGLGLDDALPNFRGSGAVVYKEGAWQRAGLTRVDWGRASMDSSWFKTSFHEAAGNARSIIFDVTGFEVNYVKPGVTSYEFNTVVNNPSLLEKTTFVRNGGSVHWNGTEFVEP